MSHIEQDLKLNFDDVLLKPKRSTLTSRASVDLNRTITFQTFSQNIYWCSFDGC